MRGGEGAHDVSPVVPTSHHGGNEGHQARRLEPSALAFTMTRSHQAARGGRSGRSCLVPWRLDGSVTAMDFGERFAPASLVLPPIGV